MTERVLKTADRAKRTTRTPIHGRRDILTIHKKDPAFNYRIVKDTPGRVPMFQDGGYEIVTTETKVGDKRAAVPAQEGSPVKISLGRGEQGYLMRIPNEFYEEDQQSKEADIQSREADMIRAAKQDNYGKVEISRGS